MITYFLITTILNLISCYFIQRLWVLHFINHFPGMFNKTYNKVWVSSIPLWFMALVPIPLLTLFVVFINMYFDEPFYFRYHKPKIVIRIRNDIFFPENNVHIGYVPKYVHPNNIKKFLYDFEHLEEHRYNPTPRLKKALSGNFHKQKEQK